MYRLLSGKFAAASSAAKGLIMTSLLKIYLIDPNDQEVKSDLTALYGRCQK